MADKTEAQRLALELENRWGGNMVCPELKAADELLRLAQVETAWREWLHKTEWVQTSSKGKELGMHRADVLRQRIENLDAEVQALRGAVPAGFDEWAKSQGYGPSMLRTHAQAGWTAALREALAQPAAQPTESAYTEAVSLATALFKKHFAHEEHYASGRIVWGPCDTTAGVISQIDNMVSGLIQPTTQQEPAGEPVAVFREDGDIGHIYLMPHQRSILEDGDKLFTRPAVPLSYDQIAALHVWRYFVGLMPEHHIEITRAIEAAHKIGGSE